MTTIKKRTENIKKIIYSASLNEEYREKTLLYKMICDAYTIYYTTLIGEDKYPANNIEYFMIKTNKYNYREIYFKIYKKYIKNNNWNGVGKLAIKYLCGTKRKFNNDINSICRRIIEPQILNYIKEHPKPDNIHKWQVDHKISFNELVNNWWNNELTEDMKHMLKSNLIGKQFPEKIQKHWYKYHLENAELQYLTKKENSRKGGEKTIRN